MKNFIKLLVLFSALVSVKCDFNVKEVTEKLNNEYKNLTESEIRSRVESNIRALIAITRALELGFSLQGLTYMADAQEGKALWIKENVPLVWPVMDREDREDNVNDSRHMDYMTFGITIEIDVMVNEMVVTETANQTVKASDSEANLYKKFTEDKNIALTFLSSRVQHLTDSNLKGMAFWTDGEHKHLDNKYKTFERDLKTLSTSDIRAKTLQLFIDDMSFLLTLAKPPNARHSCGV